MTMIRNDLQSGQSEQAVGLFDSGIGGCSVLREVRRLLPGEHLLYYADQANCPYGARTPAELIELTVAGSAWLRAHGAKVIVVACNSASAAALSAVRAAFPDTPFVGMVPAVKPAARLTRSGVIGVLATSATIAGDLLQEVVERWASGTRVLARPCDGLAECVEAGRIDDPGTRALLERAIRPLVAQGADTLVLGCTHYPFLAAQIAAVAGPGIQIIDPAPAIARQVDRLLAERDLYRAAAQPGRVDYRTTGPAERFAELAGLLRLPPGSIESIGPRGGVTEHGALAGVK